jgi:integrase/recombinase XerC/integrase/recombinase XerD
VHRLRLRYAQLSPRVHGFLKAYLKLRPRRTSGDLWLQRDGSPMTESAWVSVMRRVKKRSGVPRAHAHLFRHTFGSLAIQKGAERAAVQDMLGHESDYMTKRYTRLARKRTASAMMPQFSPV